MKNVVLTTVPNQTPTSWAKEYPKMADGTTMDGSVGFDKAKWH
jgi:hypothetical protein